MAKKLALVGIATSLAVAVLLILVVARVPTYAEDLDYYAEADESMPIFDVVGNASRLICDEQELMERVEAVNEGQHTHSSQGDNIDPRMNHPKKEHRTEHHSKPRYLHSRSTTRVYKGGAYRRSAKLQGGYSFDNRSYHGLSRSHDG